MNVYECNGTNIFMRWNMKCSIQQGEAEFNGTFHLSPNENICSITRMRKHSLFVLYNLYKDSNFETNLTEKVLKNDFSLSKTFFKLRVQLSGVTPMGSGWANPRAPGQRGHPQGASSL